MAIRRSHWVVISLACCIPLLLLLLTTTVADQMSVSRLHEKIQKHGESIAIVYLGNEMAAPLHLKVPSVIDIPLSRLLSVQQPEDLPSSLKEKDIIFICDGGLDAVHVSYHLKSILSESGHQSVAVTGGAQAILTHPGDTDTGRRDRATFKPISMAAQVAVFVSAFIVKPVYMLVSLILALLIYRSGIRELRSLFVSMVTFYIGEFFCFLNYLLFNEGSNAVEFLHMFGMVLAFGYAALWLFEQLSAVISGKSGNTPCLLQPMCQVCTKYTNDYCRVLWLYPPVIITFSVLAGIILVAGFNTTAYVTEILDKPYFYVHGIALQVYEIRISPIIALLMFVVALVLYFRDATRFQSIIEFLTSMGIGHAGFTLLRKGLVALFPDLVMFAVLEEVTELLFIGLIVYVLALYFPVIYRLRAKVTTE